MLDQLQNKIRPDVFNYIDYRKFLKDVYSHKKSRSRGFSYAVWANTLGLSGDSHILLIIQGKRNISAQKLGRFSNALNLNTREQKYFESLVLFNQAKDIESKKMHYEQLLPHYQKNNRRKLTKQQYSYFSRWYGPVIREMIGLKNFKEDPKWIAKELKGLITPYQAKEMLELLQILNLVQRDHNGQFKVCDVNLVTDNEVTDLASFEFHTQMMDLAKRSLKEKNSESRKLINGFTAALSNNQYSKILQHFEEFKNKVLYELERQEEEPKNVFQFNFHFFTLNRFNGGQNVLS